MVGGHYYLLVFDGDTSSVFRLTGNTKVVAGRQDSADLQLSDNSVSRRHAELEVTSDGVMLVDLGSQNGTLVNGIRIQDSHRLLSGDVIALGGVTLVLRASGAKAMTPRAIVELDALRHRVAEEVERGQRYQRSFAVLCLRSSAELDRPIIEATIPTRIRVLDVLAWGDPHELFCLVPELEGESVRDVAARFLTLTDAVGLDGRVGWAHCPADACDVDDLIGAARDAAKRETKGALLTGASRAFEAYELGDVTMIVGDPAMARIYSLLERLAATDLPLLIGGETGTGKELAARAVHHHSARRRGPLISLNCAAIADALVESELFGHERGAFTGAVAPRAGHLENAAGGTIFLDEVSELTPPAQAKLLRALDTGRVMRVGSSVDRPLDIRMVAATNRDLKEEVAAGRFRQDLFFRLSGATIWLPPLRDRRREIPILADAFLAAACGRAGRAPIHLPPRAMRILLEYEWPGNVRELKHVMDFVAAAAVDADPTVLLADRLGLSLAEASAIEESTFVVASIKEAARPREAFRPIEDELREVERSRMEAALRFTGGNQTRAAKLISMPLRSFQVKMKRYRLEARSRLP